MQLDIYNYISLLINIVKKYNSWPIGQTFRFVIKPMLNLEMLKVINSIGVREGTIQYDFQLKSKYLALNYNLQIVFLNLAIFRINHMEHRPMPPSPSTKIMSDPF